MIASPDQDDLLKIRALNAITRARAEGSAVVHVDLESGEVRIEPPPPKAEPKP